MTDNKFHPKPLDDEEFDRAQGAGIVTQVEVTGTKDPAHLTVELKIDPTTLRHRKGVGTSQGAVVADGPDPGLAG